MIVRRWLVNDILELGGYVVDVTDRVWQYVEHKSGQFISRFQLHAVILQWNLVCGKNYLTSLVSTVYLAGMLVGAVPMGTMADK